jgi:hypothetical protein
MLSSRSAVAAALAVPGRAAMVAGQAAERPRQASAPAPTFYTTSLSPEEMENKQARRGEGFDVLAAIENSPVDGETPRTRIDLRAVHVDRSGR